MNFEELKLKVKSQWAKADFSDGSLNFLLKRNWISMLVLSLTLFGYCAYLWYSYLYQPGWSAAKKQAYIESKQDENIVFNKNKFDKVMAEIENRKNYFQRSVENVPDIFSIK